MTKARNSNSDSNFWPRKIARASAWALLASVALLVVSGWGITQTGIINDITFGLVDRRLANSIHGATTVPLVFFFLLHVLVSIMLKYRGQKTGIKRMLDSILAAAGITILGIAVYMEYFRLGG